MASIYTDDERNRRMDANRRRKKFCDKVFDISMWAILLIGALTLIPQFFMGLKEGLFGGEISAFFAAIFSAILFGLTVWVIYKKDPKYTAIVIVGALILTLMGVVLEIPILFFSILLIGAQIMWKKLEQEEGFPHFQISYREQERRMAVQEQQTQYRAQQAGVRGDNTAPHAHEMHDVLEAGGDVLPAAQQLTGYQRTGEAAVPQMAQPQAYQPGVMDSLEDL